MRLLAIDVGTGTQDVLLFNTELSPENSYKLILPSPTLMVKRRLNSAAKGHKDILLTGRMMGGGPSGWGVKDALRAGAKVYATPEASRSFDDDLDEVRAMGVTVVSTDEAARLPEGVERIEMRDLDLDALRRAFSAFDVRLDDLDVICAAVFDHGNAPVGVSDRKFRFDYLDRRIRATNRLSAFAYLSEGIPPEMTRLQAVADSAAGLPCPLLVMDTAPAAVLGATLDPAFQRHERNLVLNIGNMHTLAFRLGPAGIEGVFEHHSGFLDLPHLETLLRDFAAGSLTNEGVYKDRGHGALLTCAEPLPMDHEDFNLVVTGPRRGVMTGSTLKPCFAAPYGDMMVCGCFGLVRAAADLLPELADPIRACLEGRNAAKSPWELA